MSGYRRATPSRHLAIWIALPVLVVGGGLLLWLFLVPPPPPPAAESQRLTRVITLYFGAADGTALVAEGREIADCPIENECLAATVQALLAGPAGDLVPVLPARAGLRGITVTGSEVQIDFDRALLDNHPGGSWSELLTVYSLANTVAVNFPHLRQVRILVEGVAVETLKGHVDLRQPVNPDFSLLLKTADVEPAPTPVEGYR